MVIFIGPTPFIDKVKTSMKSYETEIFGLFYRRRNKIINSSKFKMVF